MEEIIKQMRKGTTDTLTPWYAELSLIHDCNFNCIQCHQRHHKSEDHLLPAKRESKYFSLERALNLIEELGALGIKKITFCGRGEPTLYDNLDILIRKVKNIGIYGTLVTNGTGLDMKVSRAIAQSGFDHVMLSLYGGSEEGVKRITRNIQTDTLRRIIINTINLKKYAPNVHLSVLILLQEAIIDDLPNIFHTLTLIPYDEIAFLPSFYYENSLEVLGQAADSRTKLFLERLRQAYNELEIDIEAYAFRKFQEFCLNVSNNLELDRIKTTYHRVPCTVGQWGVFVCDDGTIRPCSNSNWYLGNLYDKPFKEIWSGKEYYQFRLISSNYIIKTRTSIEKCFCNYCGWAKTQELIHDVVKAPTEEHMKALMKQLYLT